MVEITISLSTYKRPQMLLECLHSLLQLTLTKSYEIVVIDNDSNLSGKPIVENISGIASDLGIPLYYYNEPEQNIALARNLGIEKANGNYIAFIDDDEKADKEWLFHHSNMIASYPCDGVWGPVVPIVPDSFPAWLKASGVFGPENRTTGTSLSGTDCATNNALVKKAILISRIGPFQKEMGRTGGSDIELFSYLKHQGATFRWCNEAIVYEEIEKKRGCIWWHLQRAYRTGWGLSRISVLNNGFFRAVVSTVSLKVPSSFAKALLKSLSKISDPKIALFLLLRNICGQAGKLGYFVNLRVIEYRGE